VEPLALPVRSTDLNAYSERWARSVKEEILCKVVLIGERSLRLALSEYVAHYHAERNHQGKDNVLLFHRDTQTRAGMRIRVVLKKSDAAHFSRKNAEDKYITILMDLHESRSQQVQPSLAVSSMCVIQADQSGRSKIADDALGLAVEPWFTRLVEKSPARFKFHGFCAWALSLSRPKFARPTIGAMWCSQRETNVAHQESFSSYATASSKVSCSCRPDACHIQQTIPHRHERHARAFRSVPCDPNLRRPIG
jgi:hypothetical protein